MARGIHRLSSANVKHAKPGMHCDGGGLYLQVTQGSGDRLSKSWIFRYTLNGRERQMGLGPLNDRGLSEARQKAAEARKQLLDGIDPLQARQASQAATVAAQAKAMTFDQCRDEYIVAHRAGWKSARHAVEWKQTLTTYVTPIFGKLPVQAVDSSLVLKALRPIWETKTATASRLRGRIEAVLDWAASPAHQYRTGDNPARWQALQHSLPSPSNVSNGKHHPALPYVEIGAFMGDLRAREAHSARALEFIILTATRMTETLGARWDEIDFAARVWTVPGERMKSRKGKGRDHRVPLSDAAIDLLKRMAAVRENDFIFPGARRERLNFHSLHNLLDRMDRRDITVHGFRSTFRDWAAERTNFANHVVEMALAHSIPDAVEAAYRRGDLFEKRRKLMDAWAAYCAKPAVSGDVIPLRTAETRIPA
jgi:integrase